IRIQCFIPHITPVLLAKFKLFLEFGDLVSKFFLNCCANPSIVLIEVKSKKKENATKKSRNSDVNLSKNSNRDNGSENGRDENERGNGMGTRTKDKDENEGIEIDQNTIQFSPISEMGKNCKENDQRKDCLGDRDKCKNNIGNTKESDEIVNEGYESSNNEVRTNGKMNVDEIAESNRFDNKLIHVPTEVNGNGDNVVIFDDEIIKLGSQE
ncbi:hypothetical protein Tco_0545086, partial [Tanacetum coccineum]